MSYIGTEDCFTLPFCKTPRKCKGFPSQFCATLRLPTCHDEPGTVIQLLFYLPSVCVCVCVCVFEVILRSGVCVWLETADLAKAKTSTKVGGVPLGCKSFVCRGLCRSRRDRQPKRNSGGGKGGGEAKLSLPPCFTARERHTHTQPQPR